MGACLTAAACLFLAGSAVAETQYILPGTPARILVPTDGSLGGTWRSPSFNDSSWMAGQNGVGYEVIPGVYSAAVLADSASEFSTGGRQGENHWINGYYNRGADADDTYEQNDFLGSSKRKTVMLTDVSALSIARTNGKKLSPG